METKNVNYSLKVQYTGQHQTHICILKMFWVFTAANVCNAVTVVINELNIESVSDLW